MARRVSSRIIKWFAVLAALALVPAMASAQESVVITGRVTGESGEGWACQRHDPHTEHSVYANADGAYRLVVPAARAQGQTVTVTAR